MNINTLVAICVTLLCDVGLEINTEIYESTTDIEYILDTRKKVMEELHYYIVKEDKRLATLKRYLNLYKREHGKAMRDITNYVGSPISAFILIKSLTIDLKHVRKYIKIGAEHIKNVTLRHKNLTYPNLEDLKGAVRGISKMKKIYNLDTTELVEGKLNGATSSTPMSASDCYELGRELYNVHDYETGRPFFEEAFRKYNEERVSTYPFTDIDILEHIGYGSYLLGDVRHGIKWIEKILHVYPKHERALFTKKLFLNKIDEDENKLDEDSDIVPEADNQNNKQVTQKDDNVTEINQNYEELCRGNMEVPIEISSRLICRYLAENHPFLKIAPIKMEMKYLNPDLVLFHDVLNDKEIEELKKLAKPRLERAKVVDQRTGREYVKKGVRISKTAMVNDEESRTLLRISHRVTHMTGLNMEYNNVMQVVNYGLGGSYEPHHDYTKITADTYGEQGGRRIASLIFYLSNVVQGGATVFPYLGVRVSPVKGVALFWFNLHPSGEGNPAMQHAACPVLHGSKWLLVKFINEAGQEIHKPCNLEYQKEGFESSIPRPVLKTRKYTREYTETTSGEEFEEELLQEEIEETVQAEG